VGHAAFRPSSPTLHHAEGQPMGKKTRKNKKVLRDRALNLAPHILEKQAAESLAKGKFREAREGYKKLSKLDGDRHLSGLLEAQKGLVGQMIREGRLKEAAAVVDEVRRLGGGKEADGLQVLLLIKEGRFHDAAREASRVMGGSGQEPDTPDPCLCDALVLAFGTPSLESVPPAVRQEAQAVHLALELLSHARYDEARAALKPVGLHSSFSHWKLFIKGLCAFYEGRDETARKALAALPAGTAPYDAAGPFLALIQEPPGTQQLHRQEKVLGAALRLCGEKDLEAVIPRAEYLWKVGRYRDAYKFVRGRLEGFPAEGTGALAGLSDFFLQSVFELSGTHAEKYARFLGEIEGQDPSAGDVELLMIRRVLCLFLERDDLGDSALARLWTDYLNLYRKVHGENRKLAALVYAHLGDLFAAQTVESDPFPFPFLRPRSRIVEVRNEELSEAYYLKSIESNPDDRQAHFSLLTLYDRTKQAAKANRRLDRIIAQFPEDKEALFKAGLRCMERKVFVKGMKYLERALGLDPMDVKLRESFVACCIQAALLYAKKSQMDRCRDLLPTALEKTDGGEGEGYVLGAEYLYARWGLFELLAGVPARAEALLKKASALSRDPLRLAYFSRLMGEAYGVHRKQLQPLEKTIRSVFGGHATVEKALILAQVVTYSRTVKEYKRAEEETVLVNGYASRAVQGPCTREQARRMIEFALSQENNNTHLAGLYIDRALHDHPDDPFFLFCRYQMKARQFMYVPGKQDLDELRRIVALAEKSGERDLAVKIRALIRSLEGRMGAASRIPDLDDEDFDDDEEDFEEELAEKFLSVLEQLAKEEERRNRRRRGGGPERRSKGQRKAPVVPVGKQLDLFD